MKESKKREKKKKNKLSKGRIRTNDLQILRCVLYRCATTAAQTQKLISFGQKINIILFFCHIFIFFMSPKFCQLQEY